jgi:hypothetical protein
MAREVKALVKLPSTANCVSVQRAEAGGPSAGARIFCEFSFRGLPFFVFTGKFSENRNQLN